MENWSSNIGNYELSDKYFIEKADAGEFAVYESVYGDKIYNRFAVKNWDLRLAISLDNPFAKEKSFYWIKTGKRKIGGVIIEPNVISRLFIIPPFQDIFEIIKLLKRLLVSWSDCSKNIYAYQIEPEQARYFEMVGFWQDKNRRWMIRPTEVFDFAWDDKVIIKTPEENNSAEIAELLHKSFDGGIDCQYDTEESMYEDYLQEVNDYFEICKEDTMINASTLIYDKENGELIGICLVARIEEWPLIYSIGVNPSYRGKHFATKMIKRALTVLNKEYSVLRLFVTMGNPSEAVYYELGFVPGVEFKRLYIPASIS